MRRCEHKAQSVVQSPMPLFAIFGMVLGLLGILVLMAISVRTPALNSARLPAVVRWTLSFLSSAIIFGSLYAGYVMQAQHEDAARYRLEVERSAEPNASLSPSAPVR